MLRAQMMFCCLSCVSSSVAVEVHEHMKTFDNQTNLPTVPLPSLRETCETFLEWCSPLLTNKELIETETAVEIFLQQDGAGERLQNALIDYARQPGVDSWLDRFWDTRYLGRRSPVVPDANFAFVMTDQPFGQVERAARIILQTVYYKLELDAETLPPVVVKGTPQCMKQTRNLFSTTRIPGKEQDSLRGPGITAGSDLSDVRHILVFHNGYMSRMNVLTSDGKLYSLQQITDGLRSIIEATPNHLGSGECVGHLTTLPRTKWAEVREEILAVDDSNRKSFDEVESALFSICLDRSSPENLQEMELNLLHGDSCNRWFDKSLQYIVCQNGKAGLSCEHSGIDGMIIMNLVDKMAEYDVDAILAEGDNGEFIPDIAPIKFHLNETVRTAIVDAASRFEASAENTSNYVMIFEKFGLTHIKSLQISPDAFIQLSFQLAQYWTRGFIGATYESVATRKYKGGRTEAMRVVSHEIIDFVKCFDNSGVGDEEKIHWLRKAAYKHVNRAVQCQAGKAPEQHLWELHNISKAQSAELGINFEPEIFASPGWIKMRSDVLSTSSVSTPSLSLIGFGSTATDCIGIGYFGEPDKLSLHICTHKKYEEHLTGFKNNLYRAFDEMAELLSRENT